jgi:diguanylate cyclase
MSSSQRPPGDPGQNPAEIAREAFRRLATRRIAPTPDAYREIYNEIAGVDVLPPPPSDPGAENVLAGFAHRLADTPGELAEFGVRFNRAVKQRDWDGYARTLSQLAEKHLRRHTHPALALGAENGEAKLLRDLLSRTLTIAVA